MPVSFLTSLIFFGQHVHECVIGVVMGDEHMPESGFTHETDLFLIPDENRLRPLEYDWKNRGFASRGFFSAGPHIGS